MRLAVLIALAAAAACAPGPKEEEYAPAAEAQALERRAHLLDERGEHREAARAWMRYVQLRLPPDDRARGEARLAAAREAFARHYDALELAAESDKRPPTAVEAAWTREAAAEARRTTLVLEDPAVSEYITGLVRLLVSHAKGMAGEVETLVLDSDEINAHAGPGLVIVKRGLVDVVEQENELLAALAHEIGHASAHHAWRAYLRALRANPELLDPGAGRLRRPHDLVFTSEDEAQADRLAIHFTFDAGYNPVGLVELFRRFLRRVPESRRHWELLSTTHPITATRIETAVEYCSLLPPRALKVSTPAFDAMKARLRTRM